MRAPRARRTCRTPGGRDRYGRHLMADKRTQIEEERTRRLCPACSKPLPAPPGPVGTGRHADGLFCGIECLASFHEDYSEQRRDFGTPSDN